MMRVEIEREAATRRWRVWVLNDASPKMQIMDQAGEWFDVNPAKPVPPPTWVINDEVWVPLTRAILGLPTDQAPLADHLNDARQVRDRLLTMIEQRWAPRSAT